MIDSNIFIRDFGSREEEITLTGSGEKTCLYLRLNRRIERKDCITPPPHFLRSWHLQQLFSRLVLFFVQLECTQINHVPLRKWYTIFYEAYFMEPALSRQFFFFVNDIVDSQRTVFMQYNVS